jgi:anti-anti-sigma factor
MSKQQFSRQKVPGRPEVLILGMTGEIGRDIGRQAEVYFDESLQAEQPRHVLLDLSGLTFGDSAFYASLLFWKEEMVKRGGTLVLFGLSPELASTLRLLTLDRHLTICPDQAAALAALPGP